MIEILQLFTFRATDIDDIIMNTIGTCVGYGIAKIILGKRNSYGNVFYTKSQNAQWFCD